MKWQWLWAVAVIMIVEITQFLETRVGGHQIPAQMLLQALRVVGKVLLAWPSQAQSSGDHHNNNESIQSTVGNIQHPIGTNPEIDYIEPPRFGQAVSIQPP